MQQPIRVRVVNEHFSRTSSNTIRTSIHVFRSGRIRLVKEWSNPVCEHGKWHEIKSFDFHPIDVVEFSAALLQEVTILFREKSHRARSRKIEYLEKREQEKS